MKVSTATVSVTLLVTAFLNMAAATPKALQFVQLDSKGLVWVIDVPGEAACPSAADMRAKDLRRIVQRVVPTRDDDSTFTDGCIAILR